MRCAIGSLKLPNMQLELVSVDTSDAERLVRECDFPAMQQNPLHLIMFPHSNKETEEEEIQWTIKGLRETIQTRSASFRKVCLEDGTPVGFAGWSLEQSMHEEKSIVDEKSISEKQTQPLKDDYWHPKTLDVESWVDVSKKLRQEKRRVLANRKNIWRKSTYEHDSYFHAKLPFLGLTMISVNPAYQRQGIGSLLLQWGAEKADRHGWGSFLISSPVAVTLYAKFGFQVVGEVHTAKGMFTTMFREAQ